MIIPRPNQTNLLPVIEKYVGRKNIPEFKEIEKYLDEIIQMIKSANEGPAKRANRYTINSSEANQKVSRLLEKVFGVREIVISWAGSAMPNMYTVCKTYIIMPRKVADKPSEYKDVKQVKDMRIFIVPFTSLVTTANLNAGEILAVILHEIGHNFYASLFHTLSMSGLQFMNLIIGAVVDVTDLSFSYHKFKSDILDSLAKTFPMFSTIINTFEHIINSMVSLIPGKGNLQTFIDILSNPTRFIEIAMAPVLIINNYTRYATEKHADSFAVDYGYGVELASALNKLGNSALYTDIGGDARQLPVIGWMYDAIEMPMALVFMPISSYPNMQNRIKEGLTRLHRAMKSEDIPPSMKIEIEKQIKDYEAFYYGYYLNINGNENKQKIFTYMMNTMVEKVFKGKMDLRELGYVFHKHRNDV